MTLIFAWAAKLVGERFAKPFTIGIGILLLGLLIFALGRCTGGHHTDTTQVKQTTRSSDATAAAASSAIRTLEGRTATENAVDQVVAQTVKQVNGAADADAVRAAVLTGVCNRREHLNDPACVGSHP